MVIPGGARSFDLRVFLRRYMKINSIHTVSAHFSSLAQSPPIRHPYFECHHSIRRGSFGAYCPTSHDAIAEKRHPRMAMQMPDTRRLQSRQAPLPPDPPFSCQWETM